MHIFSILRFLGSPSPATNRVYAINTIYKPRLEASREGKGMCFFTSTDLKSPTLLYLKSAEKPTYSDTPPPPKSRASPPNHDSPSAPQNGQRSKGLCWLSAGHLLKETLHQPECPVAAGNCHTFWFPAPPWGDIHFLKDDGMRFLHITGDLFRGIWMPMDTSASAAGSTWAP